MTDYGATDVSTTSLGANQFPVSAAYVPNDVLRPIGGGPKQTDSGGKAYTSVLVYVQDGYDVAQGTSTDAANANTVIGQLKQIKTNTASVTIGSLPAISGTVTANIGTTNGLALDTSVNGLLVAQGSATSGEKGPLVLGAVTTAAPTYTTAQSSPLSLTTAGALRVDASTTTQPVSGTVTANVGTTNGLALDATVAKLNVAQATALGSTTGPMMQGSVTTAAPTYTTGNINPLSLTTAGALRVDGSAVMQPISGTITANAGSGTFTIQSNASVNLAQVAGGTVATAATGIAKVGLTDGSGNAITSTSNAIDVNIKSGGGSGFSVVDETAWTAGTSAFVPSGGVFNDTAAALTSGQEGTLRATNNRALHVNLRDSSANQLLGSKTSANSIPVVVASDQGAFPVSQSGSWTVTASAGTNLNTSALALDTSVNGLLVAQGSTTSGEKGPLILGAVTTAAPTYTTAQSSPLSLTTAGALRVDASATTQPVSGTVTASQGGAPWAENITQFGGTNLSTGTGASGTGIPRVTVSNDSNVLATQSGTWTVQPGNTQNTTPWLVASQVTSGGGSVPYHNLSAASTNSTNVKGAACQMYGYAISNTNAAARYVKFYDKATAPTIGTDTPKHTVQIPANGMVIRAIPEGMKFTNGFGWGTTTGVADTDTGTVGANDLVIDFSLNS